MVSSVICGLLKVCGLLKICGIFRIFGLLGSIWSIGKYLDSTLLSQYFVLPICGCDGFSSPQYFPWKVLTGSRFFKFTGCRVGMTAVRQPLLLLKENLLGNYNAYILRWSNFWHHRAKNIQNACTAKWLELEG